MMHLDKATNKEYTLPDVFVIPWHPGAIRYFKEIGWWTPAHDAQQQKMLDEVS